MTGPQQPEFETPVRTAPTPSAPRADEGAGAPVPKGGSPGPRSPRSATPQGPAWTVTVADEVAAAALAVPGVVALHGGAFGEVGTYLPGRRVVGVKTGGSTSEVHLVVAAHVAVLTVAEQVRAVVAPLVGTSVDVYIEDLHHPVELPRPAR